MYRKLLLGLFLINFLLLAFVPTPALGMTGSGTAEDPYVVWNVTDLQDMNNDLSAYYELGCDIDASDTVTWNGGAGFAPIGTFTGDFDGNYYTISNLYMSRSTNALGLFGVVQGIATDYVSIRNVILIGVNITGATGSSYMTGGLVGNAEYLNLNRCFVHGVVDGWTDAGLLAASLSEHTTVNECASVGDVSAFKDAGGLVGSCGGDIYDCYSRAHIDVEDYPAGTGQQSGGLVGVVSATGTVEDSYSTGTVDCLDAGGCSYLGGLIGRCDGSCTDCFWDKETSNWLTSACGTGKTTAEMKTKSTFTDAGWNFDTIWDIDSYINDGYPYFLWWCPSVYALYISSTLGGNVTTPGEGLFYYCEDEIVSLNTTADTGYEFYRWTGETSTIEDIYDGETTITMEDSYIVVACFENTGMLPVPNPILPLIKPGGMEADPEDLPWYNLVYPAAVGLEWRTIDLWAILIIFIAVGIGVGIMIATGSTLLAAISVAIVLVVGVNMCVLSWWFVIVYAIFAGSYLIAVRTM